jgi:hypothetical protein
MTDFDRAEKKMRAIRSLLERAATYRTISAFTALIGGLLSFGGFATAYYAKHHRHPLSPSQFVIVWLVILGLTALSSLIFLWRDAVNRGEPFFSAGMKCVIASVAPALLTAAALTFFIHRPILLAIIWAILYGIGLLSTHAFAPRCLVVLGWVFFLAGGALLGSWKHLFIWPGHGGEPSALVVSGILAATFGVFHLAYAAAVWAMSGNDKK